MTPKTYQPGVWLPVVPQDLAGAAPMPAGPPERGRRIVAERRSQLGREKDPNYQTTFIYVYIIICKIRVCIIYIMIYIRTRLVPCNQHLEGNFRISL